MLSDAFWDEFRLGYLPVWVDKTEDCEEFFAEAEEHEIPFRSTALPAAKRYIDSAGGVGLRLMLCTWRDRIVLSDEYAFYEGNGFKAPIRYSEIERADTERFEESVSIEDFMNVLLM